MKGHPRLTNKDNINDLYKKASDYYQQEFNRYKKIMSKQAYLRTLEETTQALASCVDQFGDNDIGNFERWLKSKLGGLDWDVGNERQASEQRF